MSILDPYVTAAMESARRGSKRHRDWLKRVLSQRPRRGLCKVYGDEWLKELETPVVKDRPQLRGWGTFEL